MAVCVCVERAVLYAALEKRQRRCDGSARRAQAGCCKVSCHGSPHHLFHTPEIAKWEQVADNKEISGHALFTGAEWMGKEADVVAKERGEKYWKRLRLRVMEHNLRSISKCYSRITVVRLSELLGISTDEAESILSSMEVTVQ